MEPDKVEPLRAGTDQHHDRYRLLVEAVKDYAILMLDPQGVIRSWNAGAEKIKGYTADEAIGKHFSMFYTEKAVSDGHPQHELEVAAATGRYEEESWRVRKDGTQFWANVVITALTDEHGEIWGFGKVTRDLTERRAREQELRRYRRLVEGVKDYAILLLDLQGNIRSWNAGAEAILGYSAAEAIGSHFSMFYTEQAASDGHPQHELEVAAATGRYEEESWRVRKDGTLFWANVVVTALTDEHGAPWGFGKVTRDLTERRAREQDRLERDLADRGSAAKTEFLSRMSHELRTPLNAVLGFAQLLGLDDLRPRQREAVEHIHNGGKLLLTLVDDILDISRIEAGRLAISMEPVAVGETVRRCVQLVSPLSVDSGIQIVPPPPTEELYVVADQQRLNQVLLNLLTNAIKYNRPQGSVWVETRTVGDSVVISIGDSGLGIEPSKLPLLFTPFERLGAESGEVEGTGLGLALAKHLVELMGGTLTVESEVSRGSVFHVALAGTESPLGAREESVSSPPAPEVPPCSVLYIEDNLANLQLVQHVLARNGEVKMMSAMQGNLGLQIARAHHPDLILLDLHLPDISGEDVATALLADPGTRDIPVVILSAATHAAQKRRLLELGVRAYLTKPFDVPELLAIVDDVMSRTASRVH